MSTWQPDILFQAMYEPTQILYEYEKSPAVADRGYKSKAVLVIYDIPIFNQQEWFCIFYRDVIKHGINHPLVIIRFVL